MGLAWQRYGTGFITLITSPHRLSAMGVRFSGHGCVIPASGMGFWTLLEGCLLLANAFAILNEERFLVPRGWSFQEFSGVRRNSMKGQLIGLIYAVQYMRLPLLAANIIVIALKLVTG
ncbi:hypothetical protein Vadar_019537 [Vaccinium darrowii]|uniref:Uncharacterized protein n=1 Tax=Vaccinium darrowii TaxID=229202 RepID=A0ACB7YYL5_9ERIC|nr:hypothetical protein Vadar_019537 [Vaccinium darrowii]